MLFITPFFPVESELRNSLNEERGIFSCFALEFPFPVLGWGSHVTCWVNCTSTLHNETCEWWNTNRSFHVLEPHPENSGSSAQRRRTSPHSRGSLSPKEQQVHCDCSGSWPRNLTTREEVPAASILFLVYERAIDGEVFSR